MNKNIQIKINQVKLKIFIQVVTVLFLVLGSSNAMANVANSSSSPMAQLVNEKKVTLNISRKPIRFILAEIQKQSGVGFAFQDAKTEQTLSNLTIKVSDVTVKEALDMLLKDSEYNYRITENHIIIVKRQSAPLNTKQVVDVTGKVLDNTNKPIAGATVILLGTAKGAISDEKGSFTVKVNVGSLLEVSYVGMVTSVHQVEKAEPNLVIKMVSDAMAVDDVVVTGYFTKKKESYTGAVTTFTGEELRSISTGSLLNSLSMLDPSFVKVVNNEMGSNPNALPEFEIRGSSSLKSDYQGSSNMPTFIMDGFEVSAQKVFDLDPSRVKSMNILKDAAATAIYGSRAANGVVVIETVAPSPGQLRVSYNGSANFEAADLSDYDLMDAREKLQYELISNVFDLRGQINWIDESLQLYNERLRLVQRGVDTDWISLPVKKLGIGHKHSVTVEGGDEAFRYGLDLYYSNKAGVMKGSSRDTYGGSVRLQYNYGKFKFTNYTSFDHVRSANSPFGDFSRYTYLNPYYYPYNEDGSINKILHSYRYYDGGLKDKQVMNWYYNSIIPGKDETVSNNFLNNFAAEYDIISGLKAKVNLSINVDDARSDLYKSREHTDFSGVEKKGSYTQSFTKGFSYDLNGTLTYVKEINKHAINAGLVYNIRETTSDRTGLYVEGFPNANMDHISMGISYIDGAKPSGNYDITRLIGLVGNFGYAYDNKYLLDASVRSDGSSLFGANNRWGTFWSLGLGWNIHKEKFLANSDMINLLKIRGSIGTSGGQNFYPYQAMNMFSYNESSIKDLTYLGYGGAVLKGYGNKDLKWQKVDKRNIGVDFELFNRRLTGSANYYNNMSKDVLVSVSIAPSLGFDAYMENLGRVKNTGVELSLRASIIKLVKQDFRWDLNFNLAHNKNTLMDMNKSLAAYNAVQDNSVKSKPTVRYEEGRSTNTVWVNESMGIDPATGNELFIAQDGSITDKWDVKNYKPMGCADPKVFGNFGTTLYYKGLEASVSFYYRAGGQRYNSTLADKIENVNPNENGDRRILYDRWNKIGDIAKFKRVSDVSTTNPTSRFLEDENFVQLQSISISYQFGFDKLKKMGIERFKVSAIGNDLFTLSTIKMERGINYPFARTFSISAQITF